MANYSLIVCLGEQSSASDDTEIVCENGVCFKRPKQNSDPNASTSADAGSQFSNEEKLARAKELIEKKRIAKEEEDARVSNSFKECQRECQSQIDFIN